MVLWLSKQLQTVRKEGYMNLARHGILASPSQTIALVMALVALLHSRVEIGARPNALGRFVHCCDPRLQMDVLNVDARPGVVVMHQGQVAPSVITPLPDPTFTVYRTSDTVDASQGDGICSDSNGKGTCGQPLWRPTPDREPTPSWFRPGTYTLNIPGIDGTNASTGPQRSSYDTVLLHIICFASIGMRHKY
jgi:hypothetical protein